MNPYTHGPQSAERPCRTRSPGLSTRPWQTTPSAYGPLFTRISIGIARLARGDGRIAATLTRLVLLGAFAVRAVLHRLAVGDAARRRAAALWSANPLMISALVAGAHLDVLVAATVVCALALVGRSALGAGVAAGVGATLKAHGVLVVPGLLWALRGRRRSSARRPARRRVFALPWYAATPEALKTRFGTSGGTRPRRRPGGSCALLSSRGSASAGRPGDRPCSPGPKRGSDRSVAPARLRRRSANPSPACRSRSPPPSRSAGC